MSVTPNMSLTIPSTGITAGPLYANEINADLSILDSHDHTMGSGVQITPAAINVNADLTLQNNNLTHIKALELQAQTSISTVASIYSIGVDLYYTDGNGTVIRLTQGGGIAGASGTITGLPSGTASASYSGGVFTFQAATNTPATMDVGSVIIRDLTAGAFGITLQAPNALGSGYSLTLPPIPAQTNVVSLDTSGNFSSITYNQVGQAMSSVGANAIGVSMTSTGANAVGVSMTSTGSNAIGSSMGASGAQAIAVSMSTTGANSIGTEMNSTGANAVAASRSRSSGATVGVGGVAVASSCGIFTSASVPFIDITNQSVTLTTSGRPVQCMFVPDGGSNPGALINDSTAFALLISIFNVTNGTFVAQTAAQNNQAGINPAFPLSLVGIDFVGAGTYNYRVQFSSPNGVNQTVQYGRLIVYEL